MDENMDEFREQLAKNSEQIKSIMEKLQSITYVQPGEIPNIDLYMDQVTTFMDEHLESFKRYSDDKLLTKTMINNYTKNNLLPSPEKKKYSKDHMYLLLFIYYLKNILSINDTRSIVGPLTEHFYKNNNTSFEHIYKEIFDVEQEQALNTTRDIVRKFNRSKRTFEDVDSEENREFLQTFTFISMLCFDVYMKKQLIGKIIDESLMKPDDK